MKQTFHQKSNLPPYWAYSGSARFRWSHPLLCPFSGRTYPFPLVSLEAEDVGQAVTETDTGKSQASQKAAGLLGPRQDMESPLSAALWWGRPSAPAENVAKQGFVSV